MVDILDRFVVLSVLSDPEVTARCLASARFILLGISVKKKKARKYIHILHLGSRYPVQVHFLKMDMNLRIFLLHDSGVNAPIELLCWGEAASDYTGELRLK